MKESFLQVSEEFGPEEAAEHLNGQEKLLARRDPTRMTGRDAPAGDDAMEVRMSVKVLSPGMEHCQKAGVDAQVLGVGSNLQQGLGRSPEEDTVNHPRVLKSEGSD